MSLVQPAKSRVHVSEVDNQLVLTWSGRSVIFYFIALFLIVWLCFWAFGEVMVLRQILLLLRKPWTAESLGTLIFLGSWITFWTLGGSVAAFVLLWGLFGQQSVRLLVDRIQIRYSIGAIGHTREYLLSEMRHMRSDWVARKRKGGGIAGYDAIVAFDYGARTVHFGRGLDEPEVKQIMQELRRRTSAYKNIWPSS